MVGRVTPCAPSWRVRARWLQDAAGRGLPALPSWVISVFRARQFAKGQENTTLSSKFREDCRQLLQRFVAPLVEENDRSIFHSGCRFAFDFVRAHRAIVVLGHNHLLQ